jgi:hypothetical protein
MEDRKRKPLPRIGVRRPAFFVKGGDETSQAKKNPPAEDEFREALRNNEPWPQYSQPGPATKLIERLTADGMVYRYAFSISCDLDDNVESMQETTGGVRKQVNYVSPINGKSKWSDRKYRPNAVTLKLPRTPPVKWNGSSLNVQGAIASGSDWIEVDGLGIATFNARVTLKLAMNPKVETDFTDESQFLLVDATFKGTVDLAAPSIEANYANWDNPSLVSDFQQKDKVFSLEKYQEASGLGKARVPVSMSVRFEGPCGPLARDSADRDWIPDREKDRQAAYITNYGALSRGQYFAVGHVLVDKSRRGWPSESIELHVCGIQLGDADVD